MTRRVVLEGSVADGNYISPEMSGDDSLFEIESVVFYDAQDDIVTPTGGTIAVTGSHDGIIYGQMDYGSFLASDAYNANLRMPFALGSMVRYQVALSGITGTAVKFKATAWRE